MSTFLAQARPIDRESLSRRVYRDLREMLISGQLQPGERLTLDGVAKALGTSHMPVREAMRQLAAERVLEALPNRALRVPVMTRARFRELLSVRKMLEGRAVEQAAVLIDEAQLRHAEGLNADFRAVIRSTGPDVAALIRLNQQLHFAVYAACGNQVVLELIESLWLQVGPVINLDLRSGSRRLSDAPAAPCHDRLVAALRQRDPVAARCALEDDLDSAAQVILAGDGLVGP